MENFIFWSEIGSGFEEPGSTEHPHQEFLGVPPGSERLLTVIVMSTSAFDKLVDVANRRIVLSAFI